jgi:metal-dependent amidase/aminoacylase/carboxypeptidase family protein
MPRTATSVMGALEAEVTRLEPSLSETRRALHQHPELGLQEVRTAALVADRLRSLGPLFDFDEGALAIGVQTLVRTAERYLDASP